MVVMVVGSGGREHAMAWALARSSEVQKVYVAPGNGGTQLEEGCENVPIKATELERLAHFAKENHVMLTVVGPEAPLAEGIVDLFESMGLRCLGPKKGAARLEYSKAFAKEFMERHRIPTARYGIFEKEKEAMDFVRSMGLPVVVKADGLAGGKGVVICEEEAQARATIEGMLSGKAFGEAGKRIVIEEYLKGVEASFIVITDGQTALPLATSQDHKALYEGDKGPNTGGMGAYSPTKFITERLSKEIMETIIIPTIEGIAHEGFVYKGFLYAGLMIREGRPYVLEFNCRLGDPETQPILMRLQTDFFKVCNSAFEGGLRGIELQWDKRHALCVVMAMEGYPFEYPKGREIKGLEKKAPEYIKVFHAGTRIEGDKVLTDGGRILSVTALGEDLREAKERAYRQVQEIKWDGCYFRRDIGDKGLLQ